MKKLALICVSALVLTACATDDNTASTQSATQPAPQSARYESADAQNATKYPHSGACRLLQQNTAKKGRKILYQCSGAQILNTAEAREVLGGMPVSFGGGGGNAKGYRTTRQAAKRFHTGDEKSCERAFINVLAKMRQTAEKKVIAALLTYTVTMTAVRNQAAHSPAKWAHSTAAWCSVQDCNNSIYI